MTMPPRSIGIVGAACLAVSVGTCISVGWRYPSWYALPLLVVAVGLSEFAPVRVIVGRQTLFYTLTDACLAIALFFRPGAWIVAGLTIGLLASNARRRSPWIKLGYNLANLACAGALAVLTALTLGSGVFAVAVALVVYTVANHIITAVAVSTSSGQRYSRLLADTVGFGVIQNIGTASLGLLAAWLISHAALGLLGLVVPLGLLWWSYDQQARQATEARLFEELARGQEEVAGKSVDASAQVVVTAAARSFGGAEVEMLLRHPDGPIRYVGDEHGIQSRVRVETDAFGTPPMLRAMAARGVLTGIEAERPFCSALLGDRERPLAILIARRPGRAGPFTRADQRLTEVLVRQAEAWLSVADLTARHDVAVGQVEVYGAASRVLGDIGAGTAPALTVLRESANRLSRLAYAFDGPDPVSEIVGELHSVERAVASLLGAIALASDPVPQTGGPVPGMQHAGRVETEWTTTGRLEVTESR